MVRSEIDVDKENLTYKVRVTYDPYNDHVVPRAGIGEPSSGISLPGKAEVEGLEGGYIDALVALRAGVKAVMSFSDEDRRFRGGMPYGPPREKSRTVTWTFSGTIDCGAKSVGPIAVVLQFRGVAADELKKRGIAGPARFKGVFLEQMVIGCKITDINWNAANDKIESYRGFVRLAEQLTGGNRGNRPDDYSGR